MAAQLAELTRPGFLTATPRQWLQAYSRYFRWVELRPEKLARARRRATRCSTRRSRGDGNGTWSWPRAHREHGLFDPELVAHRWLLAEYRVSHFAPSLGKAVPVTEARVEAAFAE